jgi:hypothetical protein
MQLPENLEPASNYLLIVTQNKNSKNRLESYPELNIW